MGSPHSVEGVPSFINDIEGLPVGEYHVLALGHNCPVAMSTLSDVSLADAIAELRPGGLSIVGKTETENIGIEKVINTVMAVPSIKVLILCGKESGHFSKILRIIACYNSIYISFNYNRFIIHSYFHYPHPLSQCQIYHSN